MKAATPPNPSLTSGEIADLIVREVAELPDRTSPDDQPDMMLVTAEELTLIVTDALSQRGERDEAECIDCGVRGRDAAWNRRTPPSTAGWLPIASAPKDETEVLLYDKGDGVVIGAWDLNTDWRHEPGGWPLTPTRWMPLPPVPSQEGASEGEGKTRDRDEALEEAARVVEGWETVGERLWIAQAIRALGGKK